MKMSYWAVIAVLIAALFLAACGGEAQTQTNPTIPTHPPVPADFAGKSNPVAGDASAASAGKDLYQSNCATCHGETGMGDGPAAKALNPAPMPLATEMDQITDDYLYWRISEGGAMAPFHSVMPAWKNMLTEEQIWQVIAYLRTLS